jgi:ATP-binding protein involved in chromosome partitioning
MSTYVCPKCGHEEHILGEGGVRAEADRLGLPFLGSVPIDVGIRLSGDAGTPVTALDSDAPQARAFRAIARGLIDRQVL